MNAELWRQVEAIVQSALDIENSAERIRFVSEACAGDDNLQREVERLIAASDDAAIDSFIESPALADSRFLGTVVRKNLRDSLNREIEDNDESRDESDNLSGKRIGVFEIEKELGRGGMGAVYLATAAESEYRQSVAIKLIKRGMDTDFIVKRFRRERQILAALNHPNIARLIDGGTTSEGAPYFVMEFVEGEPLYRFCDRRQYSINERLRLFQEICSAVEAAHRIRVIHRDLKPSNILVKADGKPKLLDFGIAKILDPELAAVTLEPTATAMRLMTPEYASPEQVCGEPVSPASDIYSLGVLLYELLTGHRPYALKNRALHEIHRAVCEEMPSAPSEGLTREDNLVPTAAPEKVTGTSTTLEMIFRARGTDFENLRQTLAGDLDKIILKSLKKNAAERYQTASELAADISRFLEKRPVAAESLAAATKVSPAKSKGNESDFGGKQPAAVLPSKIPGSEPGGDEYKSVRLPESGKMPAFVGALEANKESAVSRTTSFARKTGIKQGAFIMSFGFFSALGFVLLKWSVGLPLSWKFLPLIFGLIFSAGLLRSAYALFFESEGKP